MPNLQANRQRKEPEANRALGLFPLLKESDNEYSNHDTGTHQSPEMAKASWRDRLLVLPCKRNFVDGGTSGVLFPGVIRPSDY